MWGVRVWGVRRWTCVRGEGVGGEEVDVCELLRRVQSTCWSTGYMSPSTSRATIILLLL